MPGPPPSSSPSLLVLAGLLGAALLTAFHALPPPPLAPRTVAAGLARPRAERDALCRAFVPGWLHADLVGVRVGPPPRFEVAQRDLTGGLLERRTVDAEEAIEALRLERFPPFASSAEQLFALARRVARLGATRAERWPLLADEDGYHLGLGVLLREEGAFAFRDGWLVCAPEAGVVPTALVERWGCALLEEGNPAWYRCPVATTPP